MRVPVIDTERCVGSGTCAQIAPRVFALRGGTAVLVASPVDGAEVDQVQEAIDCCPVEALGWKDA